MSEPTRISAQKRAKLAIALKRNMARRKAASEPCTTNSTRGQQAEPAMSCDSTPHGEVSRPSRRQ